MPRVALLYFCLISPIEHSKLGARLLSHATVDLVSLLSAKMIYTFDLDLEARGYKALIQILMQGDSPLILVIRLLLEVYKRTQEKEAFTLCLLALTLRAHPSLHWH